MGKSLALSVVLFNVAEALRGLNNNWPENSPDYAAPKPSHIRAVIVCLTASCLMFAAYKALLFTEEPVYLQKKGVQKHMSAEFQAEVAKIEGHNVPEEVIPSLQEVEMTMKSD